ncbi:methionine ABC transporter ATP-binding protein [Bifidobacterium pseudolongum]|uniref:ABC transporter ATP-binding protein n=1 Tax=Bifidobacterium pseudolongum subsp. pseudolongum TaxID=31954 RepID=A0A4Q5A7E0_9BIFI|nr:ATP-binding cassette domain-containing protein [Bifidobacterium pseudolongum]KFI80117.1 ABC transporter ATP-binding protein [Bifidobacterium pseudolongum subsp. pseudolongum]MDY3689370.1 ATP-binding cassette domain-containing protein [Bifidobacterium pseudolongum]PKV07598.1 ABC transporter ATP-binding protein [Bifidobacterium pseudolongum subsp. pseudolongum]RYQ19982.1 ABC transporter ATP-binding protein [Bifidobacterium pseudolongum subsp. pseudolongum]RYQ53036.1 ABC transporter ATP-bindin
MAAIITLDDVSVTFHEAGRAIEAVRHVSLEVEQGEIFGIVGFSGAGKSTLVRTINLLERPTSGRVLIDGRDITGLKGGALRDLRKSVGFVFQGFNLIGNATVGANIEFALRAGGVPKARRRERTRELLELVGLAGKMDSYPSSLSGGQKQRVSIARALANNPRILLCDEATSALDLETTEGILALLKRINTELGVTIVFITHQLEVAQRVFDRVAVMEDGAIIEQGTTFDVFAEPRHGTTQALVERFLGVAIPERLVPQLPAGRLVELRYKGDHAFEPLISAVSNRHGVAVNVLHGNVEYFGTQPIGTLVVLVSAIREGQRGARDVEAALDELRGKVFGFQELTDAAVEDALGAQYSGGAHGTGQGTTRREVLV